MVLVPDIRILTGYSGIRVVQTLLEYSDIRVFRALPEYPGICLVLVKLVVPRCYLFQPKLGP